MLKYLSHVAIIEVLVNQCRNVRTLRWILRRNRLLNVCDEKETGGRWWLELMTGRWSSYALLADAFTYANQASRAQFPSMGNPIEDVWVKLKRCSTGRTNYTFWPHELAWVAPGHVKWPIPMQCSLPAATVPHSPFPIPHPSHSTHSRSPLGGTRANKAANE